MKRRVGGSPERNTLRDDNNLHRLMHGLSCEPGTGTYHVPARHACVGAGGGLLIGCEYSEVGATDVSRVLVLVSECSQVPVQFDQPGLAPRLQYHQIVDGTVC